MDPSWLDSLGYERLSVSQKVQILERGEEALERVVGHALTLKMPDDKLDEFGAIMDADIDSEARDKAGTQWLLENKPQYPMIVKTIFGSFETYLRLAASEYKEAHSGKPGTYDQKNDAFNILPNSLWSAKNLLPTSSALIAEQRNQRSTGNADFIKAINFSRYLDLSRGLVDGKTT
jgi:hypothetical protein